MDERFEITVDGAVYRSLDELPPELRDKLAPHLEKARAAASVAGAVRGTIRINIKHQGAAAPSAGTTGPVLGSGDGGRKWLALLLLIAGALLLLARFKAR